MSNVEARQWYLAQEARIPELIDSTAPLEQQAQQAFELRNTLRSATRDAMADQKTADMLRATNPNLTWEEVVRKYSTKYPNNEDVWKQIIEASQRSRASVNESLGLATKEKP
jgi:filamentous hemagglutinin